MAQPNEKIMNESDYEKALAHADHLMLFDPDPATPAGQRLTQLADMIETYEKERWPHLAGTGYPWPTE